MSGYLDQSRFGGDIEVRRPPQLIHRWILMVVVMLMLCLLNFEGAQCFYLAGVAPQNFTKVNLLV